MPEGELGRIAIDDIVQSATDGVLRALEARKIGVSDFTRENGFFVKFDITCGGWPVPIERGGGGVFERPGLQQPSG